MLVFRLSSRCWKCDDANWHDLIDNNLARTLRACAPALVARSGGRTKLSPRTMPETMTKLQEFPTWLADFCQAIDKLEFDAPVFAKFAPDVSVIFGTAQLSTLAALKEFLRKIDTPVDTVHMLEEVWVGSGRTCVLGQADIKQKGAPHEQVEVPFQWMFYEDLAAPGPVRQWRATVGPVKTDALV